MNLWKKLIDLLPGSPLLVATVTSHESDGTSIVTLPGGGTLKVRGQSVAVNSKAFIKDNQIQGAAPNLTVELIEI